VDYARRHLRFGWWSLAVFATFGFTLEILLGFKVRMYLDVSNETRRLMWTLAHAHGTLLSIVNVLFGVTLRVVPDFAVDRQRRISRCLVVATVLLPAGFFAGGVVVYEGDPGLAIALVPLGAALLIVSIVLTSAGLSAVTQRNRQTLGRGRPS
jgi:hypothetical protein